MTDENDPTEAEIRKLGAQLRMGFYEFVNAVWKLVDGSSRTFLRRASGSGYDSTISVAGGRKGDDRLRRSVRGRRLASH